MLRQILMASVGVIALAGMAVAADLPSRAPPPVYLPPVPIFTWTGIYVGGQIGYAWGHQSTYFNDTLPPILANSGVGSFGFNQSGVIGGAHVGYNLQFNQFVIGLEGDVDGSSLRNSTTVLTPFFGVPATFTSRADVQGSIRGRLGYAWDRLLVYGTGGAAFGGFNTSISTPFGFDSFSTTRVGWTAGGGLEYAITNNWSIRGEYRYTDFGHATVFTNASFPFGGSANRRFIENRVQAGFSYKFDTFGPPGPVVARY
jgi:outer membrane immunogenic protein